MSAVQSRPEGYQLLTNFLPLQSTQPLLSQILGGFMPYADPRKQSAYQARRMSQLRNEWLEANGPCVRCGSRDNLEIDHVDPWLKVSHRIWSWSKERRDVELAKCQVLCRACHKKKTGENNGWGMHGSSGYQRGCRCALCTYAHAHRCRYGESLTFSPNLALFVPSAFFEGGTVT